VLSAIYTGGKCRDLRINTIDECDRHVSPVLRGNFQEPAAIGYKHYMDKRG
jgi:hypothetical protein